MGIAEKFKKLQQEVPPTVKIVAVSKTHPIDSIMQVYYSDYKVFGESKVQELVEKYEELPTDIEWHMIGHLQSNKVKYITPFVSLIHSVDSFKLLKVINKQAKKHKRVIDCLLQFHIAKEQTKYGLSFEETDEILQSEEFEMLHNVRIRGLMGMATFTEDTALIRSEFEYLNSCHKLIKGKFFSDKEFFNELSMGMSNDYKIAIDCGTTMIRVGSTIFGERE